ncbi:MAG TPA: helix-turn-helix transcriptional regulator [archaeon]|nr:helix-turn-helix transcriptional regulator [archaeon]
MAIKMFGNLFKELRHKKGQTLREYCRTHNQDPGYISRLERGKIAPPIKQEALERLAFSLGLRENSEEWREFMTMAILSAGRIPKEIMLDEEALKHLPAFLRTLKGEKLTEDQLDTLIEVIKSS